MMTGPRLLLKEFEHLSHWTRCERWLISRRSVCCSKQTGALERSQMHVWTCVKAEAAHLLSLFMAFLLFDPILPCSFQSDPIWSHAAQLFNWILSNSPWLLIFIVRTVCTWPMSACIHSKFPLRLKMKLKLIRSIFNLSFPFLSFPFLSPVLSHPIPSRYKC